MRPTILSAIKGRVLRRYGIIPLIEAIVVCTILAAAGTLTSSAPSCAATSGSFANAALVVTAKNHHCSYTLAVGQQLSVVSPPGDAWWPWPPTLSPGYLVSDRGMAVGSGPVGPTWEIDYEAVAEGTLVLEDYGITIHIRRAP